MGLIIPYTFVGGTSAKAQEVNANFSKVKEFVDNLEETQGTIQTDIAELKNTKANLNGSNQVAFNVATASGNDNYSAVNVEYLNNQLVVFRTLINGLKMTKTGNQSFVISPGGCYDSNHIYPMFLSSNYTVQIGASQNASTTYKVFVMATVSYYAISNVVLTTTTPTISSETIYRQIGTVTLDENKYISEINQEGN